MIVNKLANRGSLKDYPVLRLFERTKMETKRFYNYIIFENGDIFSNYCNRFLKPDITKHGYKQVTLYINNKPFRIKVHRLVALLWLGEEPEDKPTINHKDGNKLNNHYTNLEYTSYYENNKHARDNNLNNVSLSNKKRWNDLKFREEVSKHISEGIIKSECNKGKNNNRFRYVIKDDLGNEYSRQELSKLINRSQSNTDANIKKAANGEDVLIFKKYKIYIEDIKGNKQ